MKQLYVADPSRHKFLVKKANRPGTLPNILDSVLGMLPGFCQKQNASHNTKEIEEQEQATPKASAIDTISTLENSNSGKTFKTSNGIDNVTENNAFLDIFHTVDPNNLFAVLQALKELNFILANRAPELSGHYGIPLESQQVPTKEVPAFVSAYLNRPTANSTEHSSRGRARTRGNQHYRHTRQPSPVPRYNKQTSRSDMYSHSHRDRSSYQPMYSNRDRHHSYSSPKYLHNQASNSYQNIGIMPYNTNDMYPLNMSELIGSLQCQIIGLQLQLLQQSTLNSTKTFHGTNKAEFTAWVQSIENAARLCNLDALSFALSKLQGAPLKSANYLEGKETNSGRKLSWSTLKQHLTSNYCEIPYHTHTINSFDTLQEGTDESTKAYLHRVQDILECIHHTNDTSFYFGYRHKPYQNSNRT